MSTIREVARSAGVSASTVSRVLRGTVPVRAELRERVKNAAEKLDYHYTDASERSAKKAPCESIGILVPITSGRSFMAHPTIYSIFSAFVDELSKQNVSNSLIMLDKEHLSRIETIFAVRHDGYLIVGTSEEEEDVLLPFLLERRIPHIFVNRWMNEKYMNYVNVDDVTASSSATSYLISLGHVSIAFIGGNRNFRNTSLRHIGYRSAMIEAGLDVLPQHILYGEYSEEYGYRIADTILTLTPRPTAGFFCSDMIAIGFIKRCSELGVSLPEDFSIVGYGNTQLASYVVPQLTSIDMPADTMGRQAASVLMNLIVNPEVARVQILMKAPLVVRNSCCLNNIEKTSERKPD